MNFIRKNKRLIVVITISIFISYSVGSSFFAKSNNIQETKNTKKNLKQSLQKWKLSNLDNVAKKYRIKNFHRKYDISRYVSASTASDFVFVVFKNKRVKLKLNRNDIFGISNNNIYLIRKNHIYTTVEGE